MSNMENLVKQVDTPGKPDPSRTRYNEAVASIAAEKRRAEASGYVLMASIDSYGRSANGTGAFGKISHFAKLFCIGFAFLVPSLLVWRNLL